MSAPNSAYLNESFKEGTTDANAKQALIAIPDVSNATLKTRFYLDETLGKADGASGGTLINHGFVGGCIVGSANYYMHNIARHHTLRETINGQEVVFFNDAGLNTLGRVNNPLLTSVNIENFIIQQIISNSAFWVSGVYGVQINKDGSGWVTPVSVNQAMDSQVTMSNINIADSVEFNENIQLRLFHQNDEGTYYSLIINQKVQAAPIVMKFDATYASYANNAPTSQTYYYTVRGLLMSTIYLDALGNTEADEGYFVYGQYWYRHVFSAEAGARIITAFGKAEPGHYPEGDPANPQTGYSTWNWYAYHSSSQTGACSAIYAPVITYRRNSDGRHFMNTTLTTPAPDGYYIEDALTKGWFHIQNQLLINSGSC